MTFTSLSRSYHGLFDRRQEPCAGPSPQVARPASCLRYTHTKTLICESLPGPEAIPFAVRWPGNRARLFWLQRRRSADQVAFDNAANSGIQLRENGAFRHTFTVPVSPPVPILHHVRSTLISQPAIRPLGSALSKSPMVQLRSFPWRIPLTLKGVSGAGSAPGSPNLAGI